MFGLGYQELLLILVIVVILFGAQRLPDLAKSLGSSVKEFKKGVNEITKDDTAPRRDDDAEGRGEEGVAPGPVGEEKLQRLARFSSSRLLPHADLGSASGWRR